MKFNTFLEQTIDGKLPIEKLKIDLAYFKKTFNYATKTEDLYNNLIDNILFIIKSKYGNFDILYRDLNIMYNELLLTISPQIPQFLMIQKKQLLESLDTFASLNNWGDVLVDDVKRELNLSTSGENKQNYIPIDGTDKDPYSSNDINSNEDTNETTTINRHATDYLEYYNRFRWNTASLEIEMILKEYVKLFKIYYVGGLRNDVASRDELEVRVENLEKNQALIIEEVDDQQTKLNDNVILSNKNKQDIATNTTNITGLDRDVQTLTGHVNQHTQQINTNIANITQLDTNKADKTDVESKYNENKQNIENNKQGIQALNTRLDNETFINYTGEYNPATTYAKSDSVSVADRWYISKQNNNTGHTPPSQGDDAWWLAINEPVINLGNYYTKAESDARYYQKSQVDSKTDRLLKEIINMQNPVGSMLFTWNGLQHPLVAINPSAFEEITLSGSGDVAYFGVGSTVATGFSGDNYKTINREMLPNVWYEFEAPRGGSGASLLPRQNTVSGRGTRLTYANSQYNTNAECDVIKIFLNGNVSQQQISVAPKRYCVRAWKVVGRIYNI